MKFALACLALLYAGCAHAALCQSKIAGLVATSCGQVTDKLVITSPMIQVGINTYDVSPQETLDSKGNVQLPLGNLLCTNFGAVKMLKFTLTYADQDTVYPGQAFLSLKDGNLLKFDDGDATIDTLICATK